MGERVKNIAARVKNLASELKIWPHELSIYPHELEMPEKRGRLKSQNSRVAGHPEFISGSDIQCVEILKPRLTIRAGSSG